MKDYYTAIIVSATLSSAAQCKAVTYQSRSSSEEFGTGGAERVAMSIYQIRFCQQT